MKELLKDLGAAAHEGFVAGIKKTPRGYFRPVTATWAWLVRKLKPKT